MLLKAAKLQNSVRIGDKEETYITDLHYDIFLQLGSDLVYIRDRRNKDRNAVTSMANIPYVLLKSFPHGLFEEPKEEPIPQVKIDKRSKAYRDAVSA